MSKFKVKLKIQGFELEIEGSREDAGLLSQNLGKQMNSILQPMGAIIEGEVVENSTTHPLPISTETSKRRNRSKRIGSTPSSGASDSQKTFDWVHEASKFGTPQQAWNATSKAIWIMYVIRETLNEAELTSKSIADTFNKHFKQAGLIRATNVSRDLGKQKMNKGLSTVGEDTTKSPSQWFLTDEGSKFAQKLIAEQFSKAN